MSVKAEVQMNCHCQERHLDLSSQRTKHTMCFFCPSCPGNKYIISSHAFAKIHFLSFLNEKHFYVTAQDTASVSAVYVPL